MLNKAIQTIFTLCSVTVYLVSLLVVFDTPWLTEHIEKFFLSLNYSYQYQASFFVSLVVFLTFPDILAIILYLKNRATNPGMNHQFSAFWRSIIDGLIIVVILSFFYEFILSNSDHYRNNLSYFQIATGTILCLSFILFFVSKPFQFLTNIVSTQDAHTYFRELINETPYINFHVHAYHDETRTREVTESHTDSEGETHTTTRTETYQERVTTLKLSKPYEIAFWHDVTDLQELFSPQRFRIVKIKIKALINPYNSRTQEHYDSEWENFCHQYRGADICVDFSISNGITGMKTDLLLVFLDLKERPFFLNIFFYFAVSLTPFCWAYSLWLDQFSAVSEKTILKEYSQFHSLEPSSPIL